MVVNPKSSPSLQDLRVLIAVSESRNFAEAADKVVRTPHSVSTTISTLEQTCSAVLVNRPKKGQALSMTSSGRQWTARASAAIQSLEGSETLNETIITPFDQSAIAQRSQNLQIALQQLTDCSFQIDNTDDKENPLLQKGVLLENQEGEFHFRTIGASSTWRKFVGGAATENALNKPCSLVGDVDAQTEAAHHFINERGGFTTAHVQTDINTLTEGVKYLSYDRITAKVETGKGPQILIFCTMEDSPPINILDTTTVYRLTTPDLSHFGRYVGEYLEAWKSCKYWHSESLAPFHDYALCNHASHSLDTLTTTHIGLNHGATLYFGDDWRVSNIGESIHHDTLGSDYIDQTSTGYFDVLKMQGPLMDLIVTHGKQPDGQDTWLVYHRLLTRCIAANQAYIAVNFVSAPRHYMREEDVQSFVIRSLAA